MAFKYDWNVEVLAQFHATYYYKRDTDEIHWMIEGQHYRVDFGTFSRILGFDEECDRTAQFIEDQVRLSPLNTLTRAYFHLYKPGSPPIVTKDLSKSTS